MHVRPVDSPTQQLKTGQVGPSIAVITRPEIRYAQRLREGQEVQTLDGRVIGRPGDIVMMWGGEHYPILPEIFHGTYEVLGEVGDRMVVRRLIHEREAWPVISADATFDYGADRGVVRVGHGSWLYKSDENDFGVVNADKKEAGHVELGEHRHFEHVDWPWRLRRASAALAWLPALLSLLALLSLVDKPHHGAWLLAETALLVAGTALAWLMRDGNWAARAAVASAQALARQFQVAVALLGWPGSQAFPGMALWRAAQMGPGRGAAGAVTPERVEELKSIVGSTLTAIHEEAREHGLMERWARSGTFIAAAVVLACNAVQLLVFHDDRLELVAIWLPALIGAFHALNARRQVVARETLLHELHGQLKFVSDEVFARVPRDPPPEGPGPAFAQALQILCRIVGQHSQRQFEWVLAENPLPPV